MKLRDLFIGSAFSVALGLGACSDEKQSEQDNAVKNSAINTEIVSQHTQAPAVIEEKTYQQKLDAIWIDNTLTQEEKEAKYKELKYPKLFPEEFSNECIVRISIATNNNKEKGIVDPQLKEAQEYYVMRATIERGDTAVTTVTQAWIKAIYNECKGDFACQLGMYDQLEAMAPSCVQSYFEKMPK